MDADTIAQRSALIVGSYLIMIIFLPPSRVRRVAGAKFKRLFLIVIVTDVDLVRPQIRGHVRSSLLLAHCYPAHIYHLHLTVLFVTNPSDPCSNHPCSADPPTLLPSI